MQSRSSRGEADNPEQRTGVKVAVWESGCCLPVASTLNVAKEMAALAKRGDGLVALICAKSDSLPNP